MLNLYRRHVSRLLGSRAAGRIVYSAEAVERSLQGQARGPIYPAGPAAAPAVWGE